MNSRDAESAVWLTVTNAEPSVANYEVCKYRSHHTCLCDDSVYYTILIHCIFNAVRFETTSNTTFRL